MNPFTLVNGKPYPLDMRGELDDTAAFKNFKKYYYNMYKKIITTMYCSLYNLILQMGKYRVPNAIWKSYESNGELYSRT